MKEDDMGWRLRKSIGGKYFRINIGKRGINSVTFGGRGKPHVTTGKTGTRVGAAIPGTGLSYTHKIDDLGGKPQMRKQEHAHRIAQTDTQHSSRADDAPTMAFPVQIPNPTPSTPSDNGPIPNTPGGRHAGHDSLPWSKLAIASVILGVVSLVCLIAKAPDFGAFLALIGAVLGVASLVVIQLRKRRRSTLLATIAIIISIALFVACASASPSASSPSPSATHSVSAAQKANAAKEKAEEKAQKEKAAKEAIELSAAKTALSQKLNEAHALLDSSNGNVADESTRDALNADITTDEALNSTQPDDWTAAVQPLQSAMDAVNGSIGQKQQNDAAAAQATAAAAAAQAKAEQQAQQQAEQQAAQQQAQQQQYQPQPQAQQPQQPAGPDTLTAVCSDGTQSVSSPGAPNYRGMCSHHGGIAQKLGHQ
jgi:chemotaxis protein histidine kinase CheA